MCALYRYIAVLACLWRHVYGVRLPFWDAKELRYYNLYMFLENYSKYKYY